MTFLNNIADYKVILASQSPRRQNLFKELNISFEIVVKEVDEVYPLHLTKHKIPLYLSELKASAFDQEIESNQLIAYNDE